jgi:hypothetical protein
MSTVVRPSLEGSPPLQITDLENYEVPGAFRVD